ncbi:hypothetical protein ETD86_11520 [Nonomuraea turkmeniaca]|uniref:Thymidylate kinase n=1 Tax=Nonomuraea turkmeniaca TaxID=103838 RepID=A0A5S4G917_9ACTN|nr:hypothetical protein [Nonomuraea turkmeniaca]TMR22470.1 hypothetical protein ETD86_11520 [Nonomuraea turkmeniaca]
MAADLTLWAQRYEVIILEGCDGVGKTTHATALATHYGYQRVHADRTPDGADLFQRHRAILTLPGRLVLDRSFISELVYGPLLHDRCRLTAPQTVELLGLVAARRGVLIHLTATPKQIQGRLLARDGTAPAHDEIRRLMARYVAVFADLAQYATVLTVDNAEAA